MSKSNISPNTENVPQILSYVYKQRQNKIEYDNKNKYNLLSNNDNNNNNNDNNIKCYIFSIIIVFFIIIAIIYICIKYIF